MINERPSLIVGLLMGACIALAPSSARAAPKDDQHYRAGVGMLAKGLNDLAEKELRAYLSEHPDGADAINARYSLGVCLVRLGRHAEADAELAPIAGRDFAFAADALMLRAQCALAASDDAGAVEHLEALVERHAEWDRLPQAMAMLGEARYRMKDMPGALRALEQVSKRWPKSAAADRADLICAMAESAMGGHEEAARRAAGMRERSPDGPLAATAALLEARCLHQLQRLDDAEERYEIAARSGDASTRAEALIGLASSALARGELDKSQRALDSVKSSDDGIARRVADLRGRVEFERLAADDSAPDDAWKQWRKRYAGHALEGEAVLAEAWAAHRAERHDDVQSLVNTLNRTHTDLTKSESVLLLTAESAFARGQFERALSGYESLQSKYSTSEHAARARVRAGMCLARLGRDEQADAALTPLFKSGEVDPALLRSAAMLLGGRALEREDYASGERWFGLISDDRGAAGAEALLRLGICMQRQGRHEDALKPLERAARQAEAAECAMQARFECGQSLLELGELDRAKEAFDDVLTRGGAEGRFSAHASRHLATIASRQGRSDDAAALLRSLAESDPTGRAAFDLGVEQMAAGRYAEAEVSLAAFVASSSHDELKPRALIQLATALSRQGRHDRAIEALDRIDSRAAKEPEIQSERAYARGAALVGLGRPSDAVQAFDRAVTDPPCRMSSYALLELARLAMDAKDFNAATARAERCIAAAFAIEPAPDPGLLEAARYALAASLMQQKEYAKAEAAAREFVETHPKSEHAAGVRVLRGEALLGIGRAREAAEELTLAHEVAKEEATAMVALLRAAEAWAECQQWDSSATASGAFLEQFPESDQWFRAMFALGWAHENAGRPERAMESYRDVASRHDGPTAARAQFQIGECLYAMKRHDEAVAEFVKTDVLHAEPEWSAAALYEAGRCLMEQGRESDARAQFNDLVTRFPDSEWARLAREEGDKPVTERRRTVDVAGAAE